MMNRGLIGLLVFATSCNGPAASSAAPGGGSMGPPSRASAPAPAKSLDDIVVLTTKTDTGGEVIAIGQPKMQLANDSFLGGVALLGRAGLAVAEDSRDVIVWDLATGTSVARITPLAEAAYVTTTFAVTSDGERIATASGDKTRVFARPFANADATIPCSTVDAFSRDGKLVLCHNILPEVWDLGTRRVLAKAPDGSLSRSPRKAAFAADEHSVLWTTQHEIARWELGSGVVSKIYTTKDDIETVVFARGGNHAYVSTRPRGSYKFASVALDLRDGKTTPLPTNFHAGISSDGSRVVFEDATTLKVLEVSSGQIVWSASAPHVQRIAFSDDSNLFGYVAGGRLVIVDIPRGPRTYDTPTRFAGWVNNGVFAIERAGKIEHVAAADRSTTVDRSVEAGARPTGAPAWATWIASDSLAAEPSARHGAIVEQRAETPCMAKLRVWTPKGGDKTLPMRCTPGAVDPGWELGGTIAVAVGVKKVTVFDAQTGKQTGTVDIDKAWLDKPAFARTFTSMSVSPNGSYLALISVGPKLPPKGELDPREDVYHQSESRDRIECEMVMGECVSQHMLTVYSLAGSPTKVWQEPIENPTVLAFDRAGDRLLVGTKDGEIHVFGADGKANPHIENFHRGSVVRIASGPGDRWVFSEDAAGQQRVWKLP